MLSLLLVFAALACQVVRSSFDPCSARTPVVDPCLDLQPRDLLFVIDASLTMDRSVFYSIMLDFTQTLYCAFDQSVANRAGMIMFARDIKVKIPLDFYSTSEWFSAVEVVRGDETNCCSCCVRFDLHSGLDLKTNQFATRHHWQMHLLSLALFLRRRVMIMVVLFLQSPMPFPHQTLLMALVSPSGNFLERSVE